MKFKRLIAVMLVVALAIAPMSNVNAASDFRLKNYTTIAQAADSARAEMVKHTANITAYIKSEKSNPVAVFEQFEDEVMKETDNLDEGDYLRWDINREYPAYSYKKVVQGTKTYYYYIFKIEYQYLTTLEQKKQVEAKVKEIIEGFGFTSETTDYEKVKAIYDYVCSHVKYADDTEDDLVYTSWSALFQGKAVCQGYAQLIYRMLREVGISTRVIAGTSYSGVNHGWNIVKLGSYYYNLDATWDAELYQQGSGYRYFLKGDNFKQHTRLDTYSTDDFYAQYPMSANDYGAGTLALSQQSAKSAFQVIKPKFKSVTRKSIRLARVASAKKYQIKYSTTKKFKKNIKTVTTKKTTYKLKKLSKHKNYYVKFRAYTYIGGKKVYTQWSKTKKIKKQK
jgi:transglutaminase-like putative cysteine protease